MFIATISYAQADEAFNAVHPYYANDLKQEEIITKKVMDAINIINLEYSEGRYAQLENIMMGIRKTPPIEWSEEEIKTLEKTTDEMKQIDIKLGIYAEQMDKGIFDLYTGFSKRLGKIAAANKYCNLDVPEQFSFIQFINNVSSGFSQEQLSSLKLNYEVHKLFPPKTSENDSSFDCKAQKNYAIKLAQNIDEQMELFSGFIEQ